MARWPDACVVQRAAHCVLRDPSAPAQTPSQLAICPALQAHALFWGNSLSLG